jgi:hypothetical protein
LKITRHEDNLPLPNRTDDASGPWGFEVWNPLLGCYEAAPSMQAALSRLDALSETVRDMWLRQDPGEADLIDAPPIAPSDTVEWAEFRIGAQANRTFEMRRFDAPDWVRVRGGKAQAVEAICQEVGYVPA